MFELRWVTRQRKCKVSSNSGFFGAETSEEIRNEKVLQYRTLNTASINPDDFWTEWEDVPHVGLET